MSDDIQKQIEALRQEFRKELEQRDQKIEEILKRFESGQIVVEEVINALKSFQGERDKALKIQEQATSHLRNIGKKKGTDH